MASVGVDLLAPKPITWSLMRRRCPREPVRSALRVPDAAIFLTVLCVTPKIFDASSVPIRSMLRH